MTHKSTYQWENFLIGHPIVTESVLGPGDILEYSIGKVPALMEIVF